jgi:ubiquinone/menaquinone biosynthesis C-methylase UbiE
MNDTNMTANAHASTVAGFGDEWERFDQSDLDAEARQKNFDEYFSIFPHELLNPSSTGADFGVGSGRWAMLVAPRVGKLICVDASGEALNVARRNLKDCANCEFIHSTLDAMPVAPGSLDFAYVLGVLHHIPDTAAAMKACVATLKPAAPLLVYVYYRFDNKPRWYAWLWRLSDVGRRAVSRMPHGLRYLISQLIAFTVYWPLARFARLAERLGLRVDNFPLAYYRAKPFYTMRTDALDRFGTQLEQRFSQAEIRVMMESCGLRDIRFRDSAPYWCALGWKAAS